MSDRQTGDLSRQHRQGSKTGLHPYVSQGRVSRLHRGSSRCVANRLSLPGAQDSCFMAMLYPDDFILFVFIFFYKSLFITMYNKLQDNTSF